MVQASNEQIRDAVREQYGNTANGCCGGPAPKESNACCVADHKAKSDGLNGCGCDSEKSETRDLDSNPCGVSGNTNLEALSAALGYSQEELSTLPLDANLGLGCGNPQTFASIKSGETVLDLGSGAGIDCFLASKATGEKGKVIGVDMTPEMLKKARHNLSEFDLDNVEFRLGEIENLPVADSQIDVIISNCVINLSPEKKRVYSEAYRVLKPGGRLAVADVVITAELPEHLQSDMFHYTGCLAGGSSLLEIENYLVEIGFRNIKITPKDQSREFIKDWLPDSKIEDYIVSATIEAIKLE